jgi:hypothetical protein
MSRSRDTRTEDSMIATSAPIAEPSSGRIAGRGTPVLTFAAYELATVAMIGDDADDSRDPAEWRRSLSAIAWSRAVIVHGTGAETWYYGEATRAAEVTGRCLFVETDSNHAPAWIEAAIPRQVPLLTIIRPEGRVHPAGAGSAAS